MRTLIKTFLVFLCPFVVLSQASAPFADQTKSYLFQNNPTDIIQIDLQTGAAKEVASNLFEEDVSAGFNTADGFLWAVGKRTGNLYKIDQNWDYNTYELELPTGLYSADIDASGIMYFYKAKDYILRYDLGTAVPSPLSTLSTKKTNLSDISISPKDGFIYGVESHGAIYKFNPFNGIRKDLGLVSGLDQQTFGASFFDADGNLYLYGNTNGKIFQIRNATLNSGSPIGVLYGQASKSNKNDGARSLFAPLCSIGSLAPTLTESLLNNQCGENDVNLNSIYALNKPSSLSLSWHGELPVSSENKLENVKVNSSGKYFAAFYDSKNKCYGTSNTSVLVQINTLEAAITTEVNNAVICTGDSISLTGSCLKGEIRWFKNSKHLITTNVNNLTPTQTSYYTATCFSEKLNCESLPSEPIVVRVSPKVTSPQIKAGNLSICQGSSTVLTVSGCNGKPLWNTLDTTTTLTISPTVTSTYSVKCLNEQGFCFEPLSDSVTLNVFSNIEAFVSIDKTSICKGETATLSMENCDAEIVWLDISNLSTILGHRPAFTVKPEITTTYRGLCDGKDVPYCTTTSATNNITLLVSSEQNIPTLSVTDTSSICLGEHIEVTALGCNSSATSWSNFQFGKSIIVSPSTAKSYTAKCVINGCESAPSLPLHIIVNPIPEAPKNTTFERIYAGDSTSLNGDCTTGTIAWFANSILTEPINLPLIPVEDATYYGVCVSGSCLSPIVNLNVYIEERLSAPINAKASNTTICSGEISNLLGNCATGNLVLFADAALEDALLTSEVSPSETSTYYGVCSNGVRFSEKIEVELSVAASPKGPVNTSVSLHACAGEQLSLTGSCTGNNILHWYKGVVDQTTLQGIGDELGVNLNETSVYITTCRNEKTNCESKASAPIKVIIAETPSTPTKLHSSISDICAGATTELKGSCKTGELKWYVNSSLIDEINPMVNPAISSTYYAICKTTDCQSKAVSLDLNVKPGPSAPTEILASSSVICSGEAVILDGTCANGQLIWFMNTDLTQSFEPIGLLPQETSTYYAACLLNGCKSSADSVLVTVKDTPSKPTDTIASSPSICSGESVTLPGISSSGEIVWYPNSNLNSPLESNEIKPTETTSYYAVSVKNGCKSAPVKQLITVKEHIGSPIITSPSREVCLGASVKLKAIGCNGDIVWSTGEIAQNITITPQETSVLSYTASCFNSESGCISQPSEPVILIVISSSAPTISADQNNVCAGEIFILSVSNCEGKVNWQSNNRFIGIGNTIELAASTTASYSATCIGEETIIEAANCENTNEEDIVIEVNSSPGTPTISSPKDILCLGETTELSTTPCSSGIVLWSNGQMGDKILVSPTNTQNYSAKCVINGCESAASNVISITVSELTKPEVINAEICSGSEVDLMGSCESGAINWYTSSDFNTTIETLVSPNVTTSYYASCILNSCQSELTKATITVKPLPTKPILLNSDSVSICAGSIYTLHASCISGTLSWFSDSSLSQKLTSLAVSPMVQTSYYATCQNGLCNPSVSELKLTVFEVPSVPTVSASSLIFCEGESAVLLAEGCNGNVEWSNGQNGKEITVRPNRTTSYSASCVSSMGCISQSSENLDITVVLAPEEPIITSNGPEVCLGRELTLKANGCVAEVSWYLSNGVFLSHENPLIVSPKTTTSYYAVCESSSILSCPSISSDEEKVIVKSVPLVVSQGSPTCNGDGSSILQFETVQGENSVISVSNSLYPEFDEESNHWQIADIPNSTVFTVTINEGGCEATINYASEECDLESDDASQILAFKAQASENDVVLNWQVLEDSFFNDFEIERSLNKLDFTNIGTVKAVNDFENPSYIFNDVAPAKDINYYRLKSNTLNGGRIFSETIAIDLRSETETKINLYPNPVSSTDQAINFEIKGGQEVREFRLYNILGQSYDIASHKVDSEKYVLRFNSLSEGIYFIHAQTENETISKRFIKL